MRVGREQRSPGTALQTIYGAVWRALDRRSLASGIRLAAALAAVVVILVLWIVPLGRDAGRDL